MSAPDAGLIRQALLLYNAGRIEQAEPLFRRLRDSDPEEWQYELLIGLCRYSRRDLDAAEQHLQRAVELGDGQAASHYYLGRLMLDRGLLREARGEFAQAIALDPNHIEARTDSGRVALMEGDFGRAVAELKVALRVSDRHPPLLALLALALAGQQDPTARSYAQQAVDLDPGSALAHEALGRSFLVEGHLAFAEQSLRNALKIDPTRGDALALLGDVLALQNRHGEALDQYQEANRAGLTNPKLFVAIATAMQRVGKPDQAREIVNRALTVWPDDPKLALAAARQAKDLGQPDNALELLAVASVSDHELELERIDLLRSLGRLDEASDRAEALLQQQGSSVTDEVRLMNAKVLVERAAGSGGDTDEALERARALLTPMLQSVRSKAASWIAWADLCEQARHSSAAIEALDQVLARDDIESIERARLSCRLGTLHHRSDHLAAAWSNWSRGGWRELPLRTRLETEQSATRVAIWQEALREPWQSIEFDDQLPSPVLVAGWPGGGRELLIEALGAHPDVYTLDRDGESRRRLALGLPLAPAELAERPPEQLHLGRRRYLRGLDRNRLPRVVLDPDFREASAVPVLLRYFPDLIVLWPVDDGADLAVQWRADGFLDPDRLLALYRRDQELWRLLRERVEFPVIEISRALLIGQPDAALDAVLGALALQPAESSAQALTRALSDREWMPAGSGGRYGLSDDSGRMA